MKALSALALSLLLATATFAQTAPTIRRVNPDTRVTGTNVYNTLQAAHDAASNGDILIVEPGNSTSAKNDVGALNCIKRLTIYGYGYYNEYKPAYAQLLNNNYSSTILSINFGLGSSGSVLKGVVTNSITIQTSNISIYGCYTYGDIKITAYYGAVQGITLQQNWMNASLVFTSYDNSNTISNVNVTNNTFSYAYWDSPSSTNTSGVFNVVINQNNIRDNNYYGNNNRSFGTVWTNNIFTNSYFSGISASTQNINSSYNYNVTAAGTIAAQLGANNTTVANLGSQFQNNSGGAPDNGYRIANGSTLLTLSSSGGQVGMFGGTTPYVSGGLGVGPAVTKISNTGIGNSTTPITVTVSAQSNN